MLIIISSAVHINLPGCSEDLSGVCTYGVNGAVVSSDLSYGSKILYVPHLQHASPTGTEQHGPPGDISQCTHPVFMGIWDLLWKQI